MYQDVDFYLPHKSPMLLLDKVVLVDEQRCVCQTYVNEQSSVAAFMENQTLDNIFAIEMMAQTIGVWSGFTQRQQGAEHIKKGMLVAIRDATLYQSKLSYGQILSSDVKLLVIDNNFGCFDCSLKNEDELIAKAIISTYQMDN